MNTVRDKTSSIPDNRCKRPVSNGTTIHSRIIILILLTAFSMSSCRNTDDPSLSQVVKQELDKYPDQRLADIYKAFFQGFLGPAHLITDANSTCEYIKTELAEADKFEDYDYYPLPPDGKFVRVNFKLIKDGKISLSDFTDAFVKSATPVRKTDIEKWKRQWPKILAEIEKQRPDMPNFRKDKAFIEDLLAKNEYVVHHSDEFIEKYHPHYRVISSEQLKTIKDKKANKQENSAEAIPKSY